MISTRYILQSLLYCIWFEGRLVFVHFFLQGKSLPASLSTLKKYFMEEICGLFLLVWEQGSTVLVLRHFMQGSFVNCIDLLFIDFEYCSSLHLWIDQRLQIFVVLLLHCLAMSHLLYLTVYGRCHYHLPDTFLLCQMNVIYIR